MARVGIQMDPDETRIMGVHLSNRVDEILHADGIPGYQADEIRNFLFFQQSKALDRDFGAGVPHPLFPHLFIMAVERDADEYRPDRIQVTDDLSIEMIPTGDDVETFPGYPPDHLRNGKKSGWLMISKKLYSDFGGNPVFLSGSQCLSRVCSSSGQVFQLCSDLVYCRMLKYGSLCNSWCISQSFGFFRRNPSGYAGSSPEQTSTIVSNPHN